MAKSPSPSTFRVSPEERALLEAVAYATGRTLSAYVRDAALAAVKAMEKPSDLISNGAGESQGGWHPEQALRDITTAMSALVQDSLPWELLDPADAAAWLPELQAHMREWARFVSMIEAIAAGRPPHTCPSCSSRFYPSRSDAVYCSGACRMRRHRANRSPD